MRVTRKHKYTRGTQLGFDGRVGQLSGKGLEKQAVGVCDGQGVQVASAGNSNCCNRVGWARDGRAGNLTLAVPWNQSVDGHECTSRGFERARGTTLHRGRKSGKRLESRILHC